MELDVIKAIQDGSDYVDGVGKYKYRFAKAQMGASAYQHAMHAPGQTVAAAPSL